MEAVPLRELAFTQLCQRVGAPPGYIRGLPGKLQIANMNWGITREKQPALLRLGVPSLLPFPAERRFV